MSLYSDFKNVALYINQFMDKNKLEKKFFYRLTWAQFVYNIKCTLNQNLNQMLCLKLYIYL